MDQQPLNNIDTLPDMSLHGNMWSKISRTRTATDTFSASKIAGFKSGDFIGIKMNNSHNQIAFHTVYSLDIYLTELPMDTISLMAEMYMNDVLLDSSPVIIDSLSYDGWHHSGFFFNTLLILYPDSNYYFGVRVYYPNGATIPIAIDTSVFHNFPAESMAIVNDTIREINFVPLIQLTCDPEGIEETKPKEVFHLYPNPVSDILYGEIINGNQVELINVNGMVLQKFKIENGRFKMSLINYPSGIYFIRIYTDDGVAIRKVIKY